MSFTESGSTSKIDCFSKTGRPFGERDGWWLSKRYGEGFVKRLMREGVEVKLDTEFDKYNILVRYGDRMIELEFMPPEFCPDMVFTRGVSVEFSSVYQTNRRNKKLFGRGVNENFLEVGEELGEDTLEFLRFAGELVLSISRDTKVLLFPTSTRRKKLYKRYFSRYNRQNIFIYDDLVKFGDKSEARKKR